MLSNEIRVDFPDGLQPKTAVQLTQLANRFESQILIEYENKRINAKSVMGMLTLAVPEGETITLLVNGKDENAAMSAVENFMISII